MTDSSRTREHLEPGPSLSEAQTFEVTSSPVVTLIPGRATLLVGVEREDDGALRLYVGARYKGIYAVVAPGVDADRIERTWGGTTQHLFVTPIPDALFCDAEAPDA